MPRKTSDEKPARVHGSELTDRYLPCPRNELHAHAPSACRVKRGPKAIHFECGICGTREIVAPKILKPAQDRSLVYGMTLQEAIARGLMPLP